MRGWGRGVRETRGVSAETRGSQRCSRSATPPPLPRRSAPDPGVEKPRPTRYNHRVGTGVFIPSREPPRERSGWSPFGLGGPGWGRSEERRVGKECRSRRSPYHYKKTSLFLSPSPI